MFTCEVESIPCMEDTHVHNAQKEHKRTGVVQFPRLRCQAERQLGDL